MDLLCLPVLGLYVLLSARERFVILQVANIFVLTMDVNQNLSSENRETRVVTIVITV